MRYSKSYIVRIQFLGFRFHGWQKQPNFKTVHDIVDKTLSFVFEHFKFKSHGVGRTDAKVSAMNYPLQLFTDKQIVFDAFIKKFNDNAPFDLKCLSIEPCSTKFNVINAAKIKTYHYYFSYANKQNPMCAPIIISFLENLDIELMKKAAKLFEGTHYFRRYCSKPKENSIFVRTIDSCEIVENNIITANFLPEKTYVLIVKGKGFLRYQIRIMMGVLVQIGNGTLDISYIEKTLDEHSDINYIRYIAPTSGLQLFDVQFKEDLL